MTSPFSVRTGGSGVAGGSVCAGGSVVSGFSDESVKTGEISDSGCTDVDPQPAIRTATIATGRIQAQCLRLRILTSTHLLARASRGSSNVRLPDHRDKAPMALATTKSTSTRSTRGAPSRVRHHYPPGRLSQRRGDGERVPGRFQCPHDHGAEAVGEHPQRLWCGRDLALLADQPVKL